MEISKKKLQGLGKFMKKQLKIKENYFNSLKKYGNI